MVINTPAYVSCFLYLLFLANVAIDDIYSCRYGKKYFEIFRQVMGLENMSVSELCLDNILEEPDNTLQED